MGNRSRYRPPARRREWTHRPGPAVWAAYLLVLALVAAPLYALAAAVAAARGR